MQMTVHLSSVKLLGYFCWHVDKALESTVLQTYISFYISRSRYYVTAIVALNMETCLCVKSTGLLIGHFDFNKGGEGERTWDRGWIAPWTQHPVSKTQKVRFFWFYYTDLHPAFPLFSLISVDEFLRCFTNSVNKGHDNQKSKQKNKDVSGVLLMRLGPVTNV